MLPASWFPQGAKDLQAWYFETHKDPLVRRRRGSACCPSGPFSLSPSPLPPPPPPASRTPPPPTRTPHPPQMMGLPTWFKSLVYSELALQLPFFLVATYALLARRNWLRAPAMLYGAFVTATMLPILAELATHRGE